MLITIVKAIVTVAHSFVLDPRKAFVAKFKEIAANEALQGLKSFSQVVRITRSLFNPSFINSNKVVKSMRHCSLNLDTRLVVSLKVNFLKLEEAESLQNFIEESFIKEASIIAIE